MYLHSLLPGHMESISDNIANRIQSGLNCIPTFVQSRKDATVLTQTTKMNQHVQRQETAPLTPSGYGGLEVFIVVKLIFHWGLFSS